MFTVRSLNRMSRLNSYLFFPLLILLAVLTQPVFADGIFEDKKKAQHKLSGAELNRIKAEHQIKFGTSSSQSSIQRSSNPWDRKKQKQKKAPVNKASWGECRDYALHKRNRCYREGRDAYRCEQMYETRSHLCDNEL